jgi:protein TonB
VAPREKHAFLWGVAASVVFHALLLIAFPFLRDAAARRLTEPPGVVTARLVEARPLPVKEPAAPPERAEEKREPLPPKPAPPQPKPKATRKPTLKPAPRAEPLPKASEAVISQSPANESSQPQPSAPTVSAPPAQSSVKSETLSPAPPAASGVPEPSVDVSTLVGRFRVALIREMTRDLNPQYRRLARHMEAAGSGEIFLAVSESGGVADAQIARSTGSPELDKLSLQSLLRSKEAVGVPPELHGRRFSVSIPVRFSLKDDE